MNTLIIDNGQIKTCVCCGELMIIKPDDNPHICTCGTEFYIMVENSSQYWDKK